MTSNLDVVMFRNGDYIQQAKTDEAWKGAAKRKEPAWCYYNNDKANGSKYGKLYNWYAVNDPRGLAPAGWHIPAKSEFEKLDANLGYSFTSKILKSTSGWRSGMAYNGNGTDEVGFNGAPGGYRLATSMDEYGFTKIGEEVFWWTSTPDGETEAWEFKLIWDSDTYLFSSYTSQGYGCYVRCVKD